MFTKLKHVKAEYNQHLPNFSWVCTNSLQRDSPNSDVSIPISNISHLIAELNPICPFLALFGAHHILQVGR